MTLPQIKTSAPVFRSRPCAFASVPVFVAGEMCNRYGEVPGRRGRDCTSFEAPDEPLDSRALYDIFPFPPDEESGSKEKEKNRAARTDELLQLVVSLMPARRPRNQIFKRTLLDFGHPFPQGSTCP